MKYALLVAAIFDPRSYVSRLFSPENLPTITLVIVGIVGIIVAVRTLNHMRESSERQLQAYVLPDNATIVEGLMMTPPQPLRANIPGYFMFIKNSGQTPAHKVVSWAQITVIRVSDENTSLVVPPIAEQFYSTLGPGGSFNKWLWYDRPLASNEIADIGTGVRAIYLFGRIQYRDVFENVRFTNFRLHYTGQFPPPQNAIFNFSEKGNDAN